MDWEFEKLKDPVNNARFEEANKILDREGVDNPGYDMQIPKTLTESPELGIPTGDLFKKYVFKIILGMEPLGTYDVFLKKWREDGGDEVIREATEWYGRGVKGK